MSDGSEPGPALDPELGPELDPALTQLLAEVSLLPGAGELESFHDTVRLGGSAVELVGLVSEFDSTPCVGSAAAIAETPWRRAYFELLERQAILAARRSAAPLVLRDGQGRSHGDIDAARVFPSPTEPGSWRYALSNGVALASDWSQACARALAEAVERDAVLSSWFGSAAWGSEPSAGALPFEPLTHPFAAAWDDLRGLYELELRAVRHREHAVVIAVGFPREPHVPTCLSFAARTELGAAARAAHSEFLQRAGFLAGEALPEVAPEPQPSNDYHQEYYLWRGAEGVLRRWLQTARLPRPAPAEPAEPDVYVDLTPPQWVGQVAVARCHRPAWLPLVFGAGYAGYPDGAPPHPLA